MSGWNFDLPDEPEKYPYTPTVPVAECSHSGHRRVIRCDGERDIVRCDRCGARAETVCTFNDDFA